VRGTGDLLLLAAGHGTWFRFATAKLMSGFRLTDSSL